MIQIPEDEILSTADLDAKIAAAFGINAEVARIQQQILAGAHTNSPLKDWAILCFGEVYQKPLANAKALDDYILKSDGWVMLWEVWRNGEYPIASNPNIQPHEYDKIWVFRSDISESSGLIVKANPGTYIGPRIKDFEDSIKGDSPHVDQASLHVYLNREHFSADVKRQPLVVYPRTDEEERVYFEGTVRMEMDGQLLKRKEGYAKLPFLDCRIFPGLRLNTDVYFAEGLSIDGMRPVLSESGPDQLVSVHIAARKDRVMYALGNITNDRRGLEANTIHELYEQRTAKQGKGG